MTSKAMNVIKYHTLNLTKFLKDSLNKTDLKFKITKFLSIVLSSSSVYLKMLHFSLWYILHHFTHFNISENINDLNLPEIYIQSEYSCTKFRYDLYKYTQVICKFPSAALWNRLKTLVQFEIWSIMGVIFFYCWPMPLVYDNSLLSNLRPYSGR